MVEASTISLCNLIFQIIMSAQLFLLLFIVWQLEKKHNTKMQVLFDIFRVLACFCASVYTYTQVHLCIFLMLFLMTAQSPSVHMPREILFLIIFDFPSDPLYVCLY